MDDLHKLLKWCRYGSLILTNSFYIITQQHTLLVKVSITLGLLLATILINLLVEENRDNKKSIIFIAMVETVGISGIIYVSGGLSSSYMWYCMNAVLLVGFILSNKWVISIGSIYMTVGLVSTLQYLKNLAKVDVEHILKFIFNNVLGNVVSMIAIMIVCYLYRQMEEKSHHLIVANERIKQEQEKTKQMLTDIITMYEIVDTLALENDKTVLCEGLLKSIETTHIRDRGMVILMTDLGEVDYVAVRKIDKADRLIEYIVHNKERCIKDKNEYITHKEQTYLIKNIVYTQHTYALVVLPSEVEEESQFKYKLDFLVKLVGILFKKLELEMISQDLIISEEQNRIANEMHDTVVQKLFASTCSLHILKEKLKLKNQVEEADDLEYIRQNIKSTMKELRTTIYNLSWEKSGQDCFIKKVEGYLESMRIQHGIQIHTSIIGDTQLLTTQQKVAIYRIVCEGVNNSIRHGKAKEIEVFLQILGKRIELKIKDNGVGFVYEKLKEQNKLGLGIKNICRLVDILGGKIHIKSVIEEGTQINIYIKQKE